MAKRKRLSLVEPDRLSGAETPSMFAVPRRAAPIADVAAGAAASAALEELSERWEEVRRDGRLVLDLPLDQVQLSYLERDRIVEDPDETVALRESLRRRGQQAPIEVVALPGGDTYGLLSGWRRCQALAALYEETGDARFSTVQALLRRPEDHPAAYLAMIEENEIRANLSHYERARIVVRAADRGVFASEKEALSQLFASVPRARRSKIGSFIGIVRALDEVLRFPETLSERAGLELAQQLRDRPALAQEIAAALAASPAEEAAEEREILSRCLAPEPAISKPQSAPGSETKASPEMLAQWTGLTLRRRGTRLELEGPAADASLGADLEAWLSDRMGEG